MVWITTIHHLLYQVLAELHSSVIFQELLDTSSKEKQQQPPRRKHHMDLITGLAKNQTVYETMYISRDHLRSKEG